MGYHVWANEWLPELGIAHHALSSNPAETAKQLPLCYDCYDYCAVCLVTVDAGMLSVRRQAAALGMCQAGFKEAEFGAGGGS